MMISCGHGSPGPILSIDQAMLDSYVESLSSEQRLELYQNFVSEDEAVIESRIERVIDFVLDQDSQTRR